jgi:DNA-binding NarL/FixJ family response regulator
MAVNARTNAPSLLVVDGHTLLAEAIASAATRAGYADARVAGSMHDAYRALNSAWKPSAFLLDLDLVSPNDFEGLGELAARAPGVPLVIMLRGDHSADVELVVRAFINGAVGLVSKDRGVDSLLRVLEVVRQGEAAIPRSLARAVVDALRFGPALMERHAGLSPRQRQVLALVARGLTDRQIAQQLNISAPTVRSHLEAIFEKTRTTNRTAAARWANQYLDEPGAIPAAG